MAAYHPRCSLRLAAGVETDGPCRGAARAPCSSATAAPNACTLGLGFVRWSTFPVGRFPVEPQHDVSVGTASIVARMGRFAGVVAGR